MSHIKLDTPVQFLKGVGPRRAELFQRLGIHTVEDLVYHLPHRYLDATEVTPVAQARVGDEISAVGRVVSTGVIPTRKRLRIFRAVLKDDSGVIECAWPGQAFLERVIRKGQLLLVSGPVRFYHGRQIVPREHIVLAGEDDQAGAEITSGMVLPVYPATEGLTHRQIRRLISDHLDQMLDVVHDYVPAELARQCKLMPLAQALRILHRPGALGEVERARRRLAFGELLELQVVVARARQLARSVPKGPYFDIRRDLTTQLKESLPFQLTGAQRRAIREIAADMVSDVRMQRLLMGDVGAGKTVVALFAMLLAVENGYQAVFMAPTELLAEQHARTMTSLLAPLGLVPEVLLGKQAQSEKSAVRQRVAEGISSIVVGTHALIQESTEFNKLGLVVIDEQHRFGVEQREALIEKGSGPDVLLLSATPIPRTLALTMYGELEISILDEKPSGRKPIKTSIRSEKQRDSVLEFVKQKCGQGEQVYIVYPVIEESEKLDLKAVATLTEEVAGRVEPHAVGLVHGQLKSDERDEVMRQFRDGRIDVLVATTVIEVGIDVPNATLMVIEHPERFGLAQLHQLRGRVGRGGAESHCVLINYHRGSFERLKKFARTDDGFRIAELDLEERGMGELIGARQSGGIRLKFTDLSKDEDLVIRARAAAKEILEKDEDLSRPAHRDLRARIERGYERGIELFRVG